MCIDVCVCRCASVCVWVYKCVRCSWCEKLQRRNREFLWMSDKKLFLRMSLSCLFLLSFRFCPISMPPLRFPSRLPVFVETGASGTTSSLERKENCPHTVVRSLGRALVKDRPRASVRFGPRVCVGVCLYYSWRANNRHPAVTGGRKRNKISSTRIREMAGRNLSRSLAFPRKLRIDVQPYILFVAVAK